MMIFSAAVNATVMYISTDYVFDGTNAPYNEDDQTNPLNDYGLSKLEGEKIALSVDSSEFSIVLLCDIIETDGLHCFKFLPVFFFEHTEHLFRTPHQTLYCFTLL